MGCAFIPERLGAWPVLFGWIQLRRNAVSDVAKELVEGLVDLASLQVRLGNILADAVAGIPASAEPASKNTSESIREISQAEIVAAAQAIWGGMLDGTTVVSNHCCAQISRRIGSRNWHVPRLKRLLHAATTGKDAVCRERRFSLPGIQFPPCPTCTRPLLPGGEMPLG